ncbi:MAG: hypothetical protein IKD90_10040 [Clostridiales bacterium]|nr:hypothetical protein [Clostridiales bacterium]
MWCKKMRHSIVRTMNVLLVLAMILPMVSCGSLDQSLSKITTVSSESTQAPVPGSSSDKSVPVSDNESDLSELVRSYMDTLISGDVDAVCKKFGCQRSEILFASSKVDEVVFPILYQNATYSVGGVITSDHSDYSVDVTLMFPDIADCFDQVLQDTDFMVEASKDWVLALKAHENVQEEKDEMVYLAFAEALVRIKDGTYQRKTMYTELFRFHANPGEYICEGYPNFVSLLGKSNYMRRFAFVDIREEYDLLSLYTPLFVKSGTITSEEADTILQEKFAEIANFG